jgi:hypothetical protein
MEVHTCNPSYLGGKNQKNCGLRPAQTKSSQDPISTNKSLVWWHMSVIPDICEALIGGSWSRHKFVRPYSQNT